MTIQHKDIPDSERHELKGASTAIVGSVPVSNGSGGTTFQKLSVNNFTGAIPTGVPDLVLATSGDGGFKALSPAYGQFQQTQSGNPLVVVLTSSVTSGGMLIDAQAVRVPTSGVYFYTTGTIEYVPAGAPTPVSIYTPKFVNASNNGVIFAGTSGLVFLDSSIRYRLNGAGVFTLWRVTV